MFSLRSPFHFFSRYFSSKSGGFCFSVKFLWSEIFCFFLQVSIIDHFHHTLLLHHIHTHTLCLSLVSDGGVPCVLPWLPHPLAPPPLALPWVETLALSLFYLINLHQNGEEAWLREESGVSLRCIIYELFLWPSRLVRRVSKDGGGSGCWPVSGFQSRWSHRGAETITVCSAWLCIKQDVCLHLTQNASLSGFLSGLKWLTNSSIHLSSFCKHTEHLLHILTGNRW